MHTLFYFSALFFAVVNLYVLEKTSEMNTYKSYDFPDQF